MVTQSIIELGSKMTSPKVSEDSSTSKLESKPNHVNIDVPDNKVDVSRPEATGDVENQIGDGDRSPLLGQSSANPAPRRRDSTMAEVEIDSLLWIKRAGNEKLKQALETWQSKDHLLASRVDKKRKQSNALINEIYQLIGFYSVFQGVLLTAVSQSNLLLCHNWWTAFFLSLLASLVTIAGVIQKYHSILALELTINTEDASRKHVIKLANNLLRKREDFRFEKDASDSTSPVPTRKRLMASATLVVTVLLFFSALFLASIFRILCDSGPLSPPCS